MLPLDDPRWERLRGMWHRPGELPREIAAWRAALGTPAEGAAWAGVEEPLWEQGTVGEDAFAVVPHVADAFRLIRPEGRLPYLRFVARVQAQAQACGVPESLRADYAEAVRRVGRSAVECLDVAWGRVEFRTVLAAIAAGCGHGRLGEILLGLDSYRGECEVCGRLDCGCEDAARGATDPGEGWESPP